MFYKQAPFSPQWRKQVYHAADFHSPLHFYPKVPAERILVVASRGDRICPADPVDQLREKWGLFRCHYRTGGHWLVSTISGGRSGTAFSGTGDLFPEQQPDGSDHTRYQ